MPAARHGRRGKVGRPRIGTSPFAEVAKDKHAHPAMRRLAAEAARRGLSRGELAGIVNRVAKKDRDPEALMRSFYAFPPRLRTVELICEGLRLGRRVGRALLCKLTELDELDLRLEALETVSRRGGLFKDHPSLRLELESVLASRTVQQRREALAAFEVARVSLVSDEELSKAALAPELFALCAALRFDLSPHLSPEGALDVTRLEAAAALHWLLQTGFSFDEWGIIEAIAREHGIDEHFTYRGARAALSRARGEFRRAIGPEHLRAVERESP